MVALGVLLWLLRSEVMAMSGPLKATLSRMEAKEMAVPTDPIRTSWTSAGPLAHTVETFQKDGETDAAWAARHKGRVDAAKALYPPI